MVTASNYTNTTPPTFAPHIYWHIPMAMKIPHTYPPISHTHCLYRGHRLWWAFLLSSLSVFLAGLLALLLWNVAHRGFNSIGIFRPRRQRWAHRQSISVQTDFNLRNALKEWAFSVISAQHLPGKVLMVLIFCFNIGSIVTYITLSTDPVESCMKEYSIAFLIDLSFNICHLLYFGLRFLAAQDKLMVWVDLRSLVDFFTIAPSFVTLFSRRSWLGLRFIRALHILELPVVLQILNVFNSNSTTLKLSRLVAILTGTLLTSAGFIHLLENSGDPWLDFSNPQPLHYFECVYFLVVTMSTVGYGDVELRTTLGRLFVIIFIFIGLGLFANFVPEVVQIIINRKRFDGSFTGVSGKTHVVVCGHITLSSASAFMKDFLHEDRGEVDVKVLFLGNFRPNQELEAFFLRWFLKVTFYQGSVMQRRDMERVKMHKAGACLIICDRFTSDQHKEDAANLMRVISIKQYCPNTRIIVQMLKHNSKAFLQNVPNWDWSRGDAVICLAELKLGFMSQSCLVPGLSTLLTNLFTMQSEIEQDGDTWQNLYREGLYNEIYTEHLSPSFIGMSFAQASKSVCQSATERHISVLLLQTNMFSLSLSACLCACLPACLSACVPACLPVCLPVCLCACLCVRLCFLKLRLLLIGIEYQSGDQDFNVLVNPPSHIKIKLWTLGFLIASNASDARRASMYCSVCHRDIKDLPRMRPCRCTEQKDVSSNTSAMSLGFRRPSLGVLPFSPEGETLRERECVWEQQQQEEQQEVGLDSTGLFHWCPPVPLKDISLTRQSASTLALQDHVVVCVFGDGGSSLLGLGDFMMPLRASSLTAPELRTVVFLGDPHYFSREWPNIQYFPHIYFLPGSPLCGADLRALSVERCAMVVVLSSLSSSSDIEPSMQDKETIHFCVNLYHIRFSPEPGPHCTLSHTQSHGHGQGLELGHGFGGHNHGPSHVNSSNVCFVNEADSQEDSSSLTLSQAFSVGSVFSVDLLDSLMAATYFNANVPGLICTLVTGGDTPLLEAQLAEDNQLRGGEMSVKMWALRQRSKLAQLALQDEPLCSLACEDFKELFCQALDSLEILCFGLYRLLDPPNPSMKRFVITNPSAELLLLPSDRVFCSVPFHQSHLLTLRRAKTISHRL
ncbi:calcium-activated potassium channel subunit alpha-1-like isoform X3 [Oncorhynchus keta]|uniref:calcium-activated potassium channel subunit alpha-1-like isoform X3 n=1 Tax=Oncorhynchus keta TaxID=8018 RepID=UPI0015FDA733|nr:calcium-activated potassium channel subunit alpha-1-like isoform X3 [Oncorhynchus keta]